MASKKTDKVCRAVVILILVFIWGNSLLSAPKSAQLSKNITAVVVETLEKVTGESFENVITEKVIRKLAHFTQFACLGFFSFLIFSKRLGHSLLFGAAVSVLDESIQYFTPGRGPQITDVIIDSLGFFIGACFSCLLFSFIFRRRRKSEF